MLKKRPPIVVVLGHVDHGKSTLLDYIRQTNVVAGEAGGITQATSAYEAKGITFVDTPGHEAFAGMRARGARLADLAILVVSAEEGVKAQTLEALNDILAAEIPFLVALNKIDRPNANVELVKQQLAEKNVLLEGYGGTVPVAEISAKTGQGVPELLDLLLLLADLQELTADPDQPASGYVLEASVDPRAGANAVVIIKNGTLAEGDFFLSGQSLSRVRRLTNFRGEMVKDLPPAAPARLAGLAAAPAVGATFQTFRDKAGAETALATHEAAKVKQKSALVKAPDETAGEELVIPLILKADDQGGLEALAKEVQRAANDQIRLKVVSRGLGKISDNDIKLAGATPGALALGFRIGSEKSASELAEKLGVEIASFDIIYKLTDWLTEKLQARMPVAAADTALGEAKLLKVFSQTKNRQVVGGTVSSGRLTPGKTFKIIRRDNELGSGKILELQSNRLPVKEVLTDQQFGALLESKIPLAAGDLIRALSPTA